MPTLPSNKIITSNGDFTFYVGAADWYRVIVGTFLHRSFGGGSLTVKQDDIAYDDLSSLTSPKGMAVLLGHGNLTFSLTGATNPDLEVKIERIHRN